MWIAKDWQEYELIDAGKGKKLERWGDKHLLRPDPQAIWPFDKSSPAWGKIDAVYRRSEKGGGQWDYNRELPETWIIKRKELTYKIGTMGFKHTGLFPEQAVNWDWMSDLAEKNAGMKVLNLFAYTGGATLACLQSGADVVHVDASKGMVEWAKDNARLSGLEETPARFIVDDCSKFVQREIRRGNKYKGIIMDPPSYGRGPSGEAWKIEDMLYDFVESCAQLLDDEPVFFLINSYTTGFQPQTLTNILMHTVQSRFGGKVESDGIGLEITSSGLVLPCGVSARWQA
ncbi:MAG: class I SAM-dependent methyltransferase [Eubacteriales bacterium]